VKRVTTIRTRRDLEGRRLFFFILKTIRERRPRVRSPAGREEFCMCATEDWIASSRTPLTSPLQAALQNHPPYGSLLFKRPGEPLLEESQVLPPPENSAAASPPRSREEGRRFLRQVEGCSPAWVWEGVLTWSLLRRVGRSVAPISAILIRYKDVRVTNLPPRTSGEAGTVPGLPRGLSRHSVRPFPPREKLFAVTGKLSPRRENFQVIVKTSSRTRHFGVTGNTSSAA